MPTSLLKFSRAYFSWGGIFLMFALVSCSLPLPMAVVEPEVVDYNRLEPNPKLSPEQVVKIQMEALQNNDGSDQGIEITFRFASPANKKSTGPLMRFARMIRGPLYRPMLNHESARYGPVKISGDEATQRVMVITANDKAIIYVFTLSKQSESPCIGCWMVDSVIVEPVRQEDYQQS